MRTELRQLTPDELQLQEEFDAAVATLITLRNMLTDKPHMFRAVNRMGGRLGELRRELGI